MAATTSAGREPVEVIESLNPATGEILGTVPLHGESEVGAAVRRARTAADAWAAFGFARRRGELVRFRRAIARRADEFADLIRRENGKPRLDGLIEVMMSLTHLDHAARRAEKALRPRRVSPGALANCRASIRYQPLGVIGLIGPWNYPLFTPMGSISYALAAGNAVVFKPSELTPLVGQMVAEVAAESFSVPHLLQVVTGDGRTGAALARSGVDKIAFTGSAATGRRVMAAAAERLTPVLLELGGKDALVVAEDADLDRAAEAAVYGALHNAGQACVSIERCYVAAPVYKKFVDKVVEETARVTWGPGEEAAIGAITSPAQVAIIRDHIDDAVARGATVLCGGVEGIQGAFVPPTVLVDVTPEMKVMKEETFGPVLPIARVSSAQEGLEEANASAYGLGSAIFGRAGVRELAARIRAGATGINAVLAFSAVPSLPFGGLGESGFGRIHGDEGLREFSHVHSVLEERFALPMSLTTFKTPPNVYQRLRGLIGQLYGGGTLDRAGEVVRKLLG
jgi:acyl-CoA reductase-like NAD-dependent aldehyde dehydrogenase